MSADIEVIAVYATNVGTYVRIDKRNAGKEVVFTVTCDACSSGTWAIATSATKHAGHVDYESEIGRAFGNAARDANTHATSCQRLPEHMWPAGGAL